MQLRDKIWLWGHPEHRYDNEYGNNRISRMTPVEGISYLGGRNLFMVPVGWDINRRQYNKSFTPLKQVGWEIWDAGNNPEIIEPLIKEAEEFPNITSAVFDDFIRGGLYKKMPLENMYKVRDRLHNNEVRPLSMWMVLYTEEFGINKKDDEEFEPYIDPFDGIIMWTWKESDIAVFEEKYEIFKKMTPGKRRMFGCYLYNFGESKQATGKSVRWQLDRYREELYKGNAEGIVLHTNTMADLDYEAYDVAREWMALHGDEEID